MSAAIRCAVKGHRVVVFEQGINAGGVSVSWNRKGYHFEGGMHWLVGSSPRIGSIYKRWKEVGALQDNNPISFRDPVYVYRRDGVCLNLWRDIDKLEAEMLEFDPSENKATKRFCRTIRQAISFFCAPGNARELLLKIVRTPVFALKLPGILKKNSGELTSMFSNPYLRGLVNNMVDPEQNAISLVYTMATFLGGDSGYPKGGSTTMVQNMLERAESLGVEIRYRSKVERVLVRDGRAIGVRCNGELFPADDVIVTTDTVRALDTMFDTPLKERWIKKLHVFKNPQTCMFLSLGVESELEGLHSGLRIETKYPTNIALTEHKSLWISIYRASETGYAPEGCSALTVILFGDSYDFWKSARELGHYKDAKEKVADFVIKVLENELPQLKDKIKVIDLATPLTYERYCGNFRGAWMSMWPKGVLPVSVPATCRSVKGLHFAGFRTQLSGGLPVALNSGYKSASAV